MDKAMEIYKLEIRVDNYGKNIMFVESSKIEKETTKMYKLRSDLDYKTQINKSDIGTIFTGTYRNAHNSIGFKTFVDNKDKIEEYGKLLRQRVIQEYLKIKEEFENMAKAINSELIVKKYSNDIEKPIDFEITNDMF